MRKQILTFQTLAFACHVFAFLCIAFATRALAHPLDNYSAVILSYHQIGNDSTPETSLRQDQFDAQIDLLQNGDYTVLPVAEIISRLAQNISLPPRTIGITFDGGYSSAADYAFQALEKAGLPFTIFIAPGQISTQNPAYLNWKDIKRLSKKEAVDIGLHGYYYERQAPESFQADLNRSLEVFRQNLKKQPKLFAFPFGEYTQEMVSVLKTYEFDGIFGSQSGSLHPKNIETVMPRFAITEEYGDLTRFKMVTEARPFVTDLAVPEAPIINGSHFPLFGFSIDQGHDLAAIEKTTCFLSPIGRVMIDRPSPYRFEIRIPETMDLTKYPRRTRLNCTMPAGPIETGDTDPDTAWRWFGLLAINPLAAAPAP